MAVTRHAGSFCLVALFQGLGGWPAVASAAAPPAPTPRLGVETAARAVQPGELVVYRITAPDDATAVTVTAFDRISTGVRSAEGRWIALVGIDLDTAAGPVITTVTAASPGGTASAARRLRVLPKRFPTRRLRVNPALVEPPPEALERIRRETERTSGIYASPETSALWAGPFARPVQERANSRFGSRSIFNGVSRSPHAGADFLSGTGTPVKAPNAGRVRLADELYFSGNTVIIDHGLGLFSLFAHLSEFTVREGDLVTTADVVGRVGATGRVTGPHLHWAVRVNGARIDPLSLLALLGSARADRDARPPTTPPAARSRSGATRGSDRSR